MIEGTINDGRTVAGGGKDAILARRYHILRQLGQGTIMCNLKMV